MTSSDLIAAGAAGIALASLLIAAAVYRLAQRAEAREATTALMNEWWGKEMRALRGHYRQRVTPRLRALRTDGQALSFKELEDRWPEDRGQLRAFCFFFDRVGWLGAAGLVDVDYILAAFQHYVLEVWMTVKPLVGREREPANSNPVFLAGFEWLDKRSQLRGKDQARLIRSKFRHPRLVTRKEERIWRTRIQQAAGQSVSTTADPGPGSPPAEGPL